jgi:hypothetical protein
MKRVFLLAAAFAAVSAVPATAHATAWQGVVIAKDAKRKAVVTASGNGRVRTLRAPKAFRRLRVGRAVAVRAAALPDGTFAARAVKPLGRTKHVRVRAVVVKRSGGRLILSGGRSVFSLRLRTASTMNDGGGLEPGDEVSVDADCGDDGLSADEDEVDQVGHVDRLELEGIYLSTSDGVLDVAVVHRGLVHVTIPDGVDVPDFAPGDEIFLVVSIEADGSFALIKAENEDEADPGSDDGDGVDMDTGKKEFIVKGVLASLSADSVAVKVEQHPEPVRCAVRDGFDLSGFKVGQLVMMKCRYVDGRFVLLGLRAKDTVPPDKTKGEFTVTGFIVRLESWKVGVKVQGHDDPLYCKLRDGQDLTGFALGDFVEMHCHYDPGVGWYVLASLKSDRAAIPEDGKAWFTLAGQISELGPLSVALTVEHHPLPVRCAVPSGMDLRGFAVGDAVEIHCHNDGSGFYVASIKSQNAVWPEDAMPWFTLSGTLSSIGVDSVAVTVSGHPEPVRCAVPAGTDLSGFAVGDLVEMHCHFHDGRFNLAYLKSAHAFLKLED